MSSSNTGVDDDDDDDDDNASNSSNSSNSRSSSKTSSSNRRSSSSSSRSVPATTTPTPTTTTINLPTKRDRLLLYTKMESVVEQKIRTLQSLPDTRPRNWRGRTLKQYYPEPSTVKTRGRQVYFLRMELLPIVAASLLLPVADLHQTTETKQQQQQQQPYDYDAVSMEDPIACMTLLLSNFLLLSKGNYDARIRHTIKAVCVELFQELHATNEYVETTPTASMVLSSASYYYTPAKAIYSLTLEKEKKKSANKRTVNDPSLRVVQEEEDEGVDIRNDDKDDDSKDTTSADCAASEEKDSDIDLLSVEGGNDLILLESMEDSDDVNYDDDGDDDDTSILPAVSLINEPKTTDDVVVDKVEDGFVSTSDGPTDTTVAASDDTTTITNPGAHDDKADSSVTAASNDKHSSTDKTDIPPKRATIDSTTDSNGHDKKKKSAHTCIHLPATSLQIAKERFETLEKTIATDILQVMLEKEAKKQAAEKQAAAAAAPSTQAIIARTTLNHKQLILRSLQIGTVSLIVGSLFAFTGGLAAPALVAAITAFGVGTAIPAFATLTTTAALASMFGVVGGGLAAYKMKKRTDGLSDWRIRKETSHPNVTATATTTTIRGLHATVCVSGWLKSKQDFQTPFGVQANDPPSENDLEVLQRFFSVHAPEKIPFAKALLKAHNVDSNIIAESISGLGLTKKVEMKKSRDEMFKRLEVKYGRDPRQLLPLAAAAAATNVAAPKHNATIPSVVAPTCSMFLLDEATQRAIKDLLDAHVLDEQHAKEMEEIFEANLMLGQMEMMNAEMFANMTSDTLEAMKGDNSEDSSRVDTDSTRTSSHIVVDDAENVDDVENLKEGGIDEEMEEQITDLSTMASDEQDQLREEVLETTTSTLLEDDATISSNTDEALHQKESEEALQQTKTSATNNVDASTKSGDEELDESLKKTAASTDHVDLNEVVESTVSAAIDVDASSWKDDEEARDDSVIPSISIPGDHTIKAQPCLTSVSSSESLVSDTALHAGISRDTSIVVETLGDQENSSHSNGSASGKETRVTSSPNKMDHSLLVWDWEANYSGELYTVTWETEFLVQLCRVVEVLFMEVSSQVSKEVLKQTLIGGMVSAVAIPSALTTAIGVIDDPYQLISFRSEKAGVELAQCLLQSEERRPVSLVGFSFGARVVFSCLLELARHQTIWEEQEAKPKEDTSFNETASTEQKTRARKAMAWMSHKARRNKKAVYVEYKREPASIVEDVVLIGLPMRIDRKEWIACRELIAGRLVNCYNKSDWVLSYMINIRCWNGVNKAGGTHPIQDIEGVENYEVSHLASRHDRYPLAVPHILHEVGYGEPWRKVKKVDQETI